MEIVMRHLKQQLTAIASILIFSIGLMLSSSVFAAKPLQIGDTGPGGGIIFHISEDGKYGLEAAQDDQSSGEQWYNGTDKITHAVKSGINGGSFNTDRIIINQGNGSYAALLCANYNGGGYGDWYLPSKDELNLMYTNLHSSSLGGFASANYWSSSEVDSGFAWSQAFYNGLQIVFNKIFMLEVRAVRAF